MPEPYVQVRRSDGETRRRTSPSTVAEGRFTPGAHFPVAVVGGGQAGLSMSYCLRERGIGHVVLEANRVGHEWRERRWDSFCLVTPNWQCKLPGFAYQGS